MQESQWKAETGNVKPQRMCIQCNSVHTTSVNECHCQSYSNNTTAITYTYSIISFQTEYNNTFYGPIFRLHPAVWCDIVHVCVGGALGYQSSVMECDSGSLPYSVSKSQPLVFVFFNYTLTPSRDLKFSFGIPLTEYIMLCKLLLFHIKCDNWRSSEKRTGLKGDTASKQNWQSHVTIQAWWPSEAFTATSTHLNTCGRF